jgi:hypothetical protein
VPRAENTVLRVSRYTMRGLWKIWPLIAEAFYGAGSEKSEDFLATFAPFYLITVQAIWVVMLLFGWGLFFYGIRDQLHPPGMTFSDSVYFAGTSLLTIGYGDIVPHSMPARAASILCAVTGLGVLAIVISFLFSIFGAFQQRERFVVTIGARAGVPPSGLGLLLAHAKAGMRTDVAQVFRDGQDWTAGVMETHLAYPVLTMFRSSHDYESWVGTLGTLMDAASLVISALDPEHLENPQSRGQARILYNLGRHLAHDFAAYFKLETVVTQEAGIERFEFDAACEHLRNAGFILRADDAAWEDFVRLRGSYGPALNAMARWLRTPPLQWIGDRSLIARQKAHIG